jgi:cytochrome c-type biogenesis protein CcmH
MIQDRNYSKWLAWSVLIGLLLAVNLWGGVALGQTESPAADVTADEVNLVARELWCPLCSGVRLDSCELKACDQMKEVIALKLAEGQDADAIRDYFVAQYGPQVLGEPPRAGFNWLAWILPVVAVVAGGVFFWRMTQRMVQPQTGQANVAPLTSRSQAKPTTSDAPSNDEYAQKLEEELAKYG